MLICLRVAWVRNCKQKLNCIFLGAELGSLQRMLSWRRAIEYECLRAYSTEVHVLSGEHKACRGILTKGRNEGRQVLILNSKHQYEVTLDDNIYESVRIEGSRLGLGPASSSPSKLVGDNATSTGQPAATIGSADELERGPRGLEHFVRALLPALQGAQSGENFA